MRLCSPYWQPYSLPNLLAKYVITIGVVGFILDRLMSVVEKRFKAA